VPPCIKIPLPALPGPISFSLAPPLPKLAISLPNICCIGPIGISIDLGALLPPLTITVDFMAPVRVAFAAIEELIALLPLDCPFNP